MMWGKSILRQRHAEPVHLMLKFKEYVGSGGLTCRSTLFPTYANIYKFAYVLISWGICAKNAQHRQKGSHDLVASGYLHCFVHVSPGHVMCKLWAKHMSKYDKSYSWLWLKAHGNQGKSSSAANLMQYPQLPCIQSLCSKIHRKRLYYNTLMHISPLLETSGNTLLSAVCSKTIEWLNIQ